MLRQHASTMVVCGLFIALCVLNAKLTMARTPSPWRRPSSNTLPRGFVVVAIALVLFMSSLIALLLWRGLHVMSWQAGFVWTLCAVTIAFRDDHIWIRTTLLATLVAAATFTVMVPGVMAVQVMWLAPMLALAGFLPRLMIGLRTLTGRTFPQLTNVWLWLGIVIAAVILDAGIMANGTIDMIRISEGLGLSEPFLLYFNTPWGFSLGELLLYAVAWLDIGMFTGYAVFGMFGALALWARRLREPWIVWLPIGMLCLTVGGSIIGSVVIRGTDLRLLGHAVLLSQIGGLICIAIVCDERSRIFSNQL